MKRLFLCLVLSCGCSRAASPPRPSAERSDAPRPVEVTPVLERALDTTIPLQGELSAYETVALHARVQGYLEEVLVDRGSVVRKGQILARLSAPELIAQRAEAEAKAEEDGSTLERLRAAAATPGVVAKHDLEIAEARLSASRAHLDALRAMEGYLQIRAPFDGVISDRNVHPGALVGPPAGGEGVALLRIEQISRLRLTVAVPEADVGGMSIGGTADFVVSSWPGERFSGTIARIAHRIDVQTRTMPVELEVSNGDARLAAGMFAEVEWPVRRPTPSLWIPLTAFVETAERTYADRVTQGVVEIVPLRRGRAIGNRLEVFGSLAEGDLVLTRGSEELRDGDAVTPQLPSSTAGR